MQTSLSFSLLVIWGFPFLLQEVSSQTIHPSEKPSDFKNMAATPALGKLMESSPPLLNSEGGRSIHPDSARMEVVEGTTLYNYNDAALDISEASNQQVEQTVHASSHMGEQTMHASSHLGSIKTPEIHSSVNINDHTEKHNSVDETEDYFVADYENMEYYYEDFNPEDGKTEGVDMLQFLEDFLGESENTETSEAQSEEELMQEMVKQHYSQEEKILPDQSNSNNKISGVLEDTLLNHQEHPEESVFQPEQVFDVDPEDTLSNHKIINDVPLDHLKFEENLVLNDGQTPGEPTLIPEDLQPIEDEQELQSLPVYQEQKIKIPEGFQQNQKRLEDVSEYSELNLNIASQLNLEQVLDISQENSPSFLKKSLEDLPEASLIDQELATSAHNMEQVSETLFVNQQGIPEVVPVASLGSLEDTPEISKLSLDPALDEEVLDYLEQNNEQEIDNLQNIANLEQNEELSIILNQELETEVNNLNIEPVTEVERLNHDAEPFLREILKPSIKQKTEFFPENQELDFEAQNQNLEFEKLKENEQLNMGLESEVYQTDLKTITNDLQQQEIKIPEVHKSNLESELHQPNLEQEKLQQPGQETRLHNQESELHLPDLEELQQPNTEQSSKFVLSSQETFLSEVHQSNKEPGHHQSNMEFKEEFLPSSEFQKPSQESELHQSHLELQVEFQESNAELKLEFQQPSRIPEVHQSNPESNLHQSNLELEELQQFNKLKSKFEQQKSQETQIPELDQSNQQLELGQTNQELESEFEQPNLDLEHSHLQPPNQHPEVHRYDQESELLMTSSEEESDEYFQSNLETQPPQTRQTIRLIEPQVQLPYIVVQQFAQEMELKFLQKVADDAKLNHEVVYGVLFVEANDFPNNELIEESLQSINDQADAYLPLSKETQTTEEFNKTVSEELQPVANAHISTIELLSIQEGIDPHLSYFSEEELIVPLSSSISVTHPNPEQNGDQPKPVSSPEDATLDEQFSNIGHKVTLEDPQLDLDEFSGKNFSMEQITSVTTNEFTLNIVSNDISSLPESSSFENNIHFNRSELEAQMENYVITEAHVEIGMIMSKLELGENDHSTKESPVKIQEDSRAYSPESWTLKDEAIPDDGTLEEDEYVEWLMQFVPASLHSWSHGWSFSTIFGNVSGELLVLLVIVAISFLAIFGINQFLVVSSRERPLIAKMAEMDKKLFSATNKLLCMKKTNSDNANNVEVAQELSKQLNEVQKALEKAKAESMEAKLESEKECQDALQLRGRCEDLTHELKTVRKEKDDAVEKSIKVEGMMEEALLLNVDKDKGNEDSQVKMVELVTQLQQQIQGHTTLLDKYELALKKKEKELKDLRKEAKQLRKEAENSGKELDTAIKEFVESENRIATFSKTEEKQNITIELVQTQLNDKKLIIENMESEVFTLKNRLLEFTNEDKIKEGSIEELKEMLIFLEDSRAGKDFEGSLDSNVPNVKELAKIRLQERKDIEEGLRKEILDTKEKLIQVELELSKVKEENDDIRMTRDQAAIDEDDAKTKLDVLTEFFNKKETEMQKQLNQQSVKFEHEFTDSESVQIKFLSVTKELEASKETLKLVREDFEEMEKSQKITIAEQEKKSYEHWAVARQAERNLANCEGEMRILRNRLTIVEAKNRDMAKEMKVTPFEQKIKREPVIDKKFDTDRITGTQFQPIELDLPPLPGLSELSEPNHLPPLPGSLSLPKMTIPTIMPPTLIDARLPPVGRMSQTHSHRSAGPDSPRTLRKRSCSPSKYRPQSRSPSPYRSKSRSPSGHRPESRSPSGYRPESRSPSGYRPKSHSPSRQRTKPSTSSKYEPYSSFSSKHRPDSSSSSRYEPNINSKRLGVEDSYPSKYSVGSKLSDRRGSGRDCDRRERGDMDGSLYRSDQSYSEREDNGEVFFNGDNEAREDRPNMSISRNASYNKQ